MYHNFSLSTEYSQPSSPFQGNNSQAYLTFSKGTGNGKVSSKYPQPFPIKYATSSIVSPVISQSGEMQLETKSLKKRIEQRQNNKSLKLKVALSPNSLPAHHGSQMNWSQELMCQEIRTCGLCTVLQAWLSFMNTTFRTLVLMAESFKRCICYVCRCSCGREFFAMNFSA